MARVAENGQSLRFDSSGNEKWPPTYWPTQKLVVHHTATQNNDPDPAATVRAIYRYHAIDRGFGDIGYPSSTRAG